MNQKTADQIADAIRTAPLGNAAREATARHLAAKLAPPDREHFIQRCMGWAPAIQNVGL